MNSLSNQDYWNRKFNIGDFVGHNAVSSLVYLPDESDETGRCLRALKNIDKYTLLIVFGGHVMSLEEYKETEVYSRDLAFQIGLNKLLGIKYFKELTINEKPNLGEYVDHSCNPSALVLGEDLLIAGRDIKEGEKITFHYATTDYREKGGVNLECTCEYYDKSHLVMFDDWNKPEIKSKFEPYFFSPYLIRMQQKNNEIKFLRENVDIEKHLYGKVPMANFQQYFLSLSNHIKDKSKPLKT